MRALAAYVFKWTTLPWAWPGADLAKRFQYYGANVAIYWAAIWFYQHNSYYQDFLDPRAQHLMVGLVATYSVLGLAAYLLVPAGKLQPSRGYIVLQALRRLSLGYLKYLKNLLFWRRLNLPRWTELERVSLLFFVVKFFFLPMMLTYLIGNFGSLNLYVDQAGAAASLWSADGFIRVIYPLLFSLFLVIDVFFFCFGYLFESRYLGNKVRSVEPTLLGWAVTIACYAPFNSMVSGVVPWYSNESGFFHSSAVTCVLYVLSLVFMGIYAWASVALGPKASNLTNRGIVASGPYKYVRHPAYTFKNLAWWVGIVPVFGLAAVVSMAFWSTIYFLRAVTEERHLSRDPEYQAYCQKVKYRFIPGVA